MSASEEATVHRTPEPRDLRESLEMMLGRTVTVSNAGRIPPEGVIPVAVGPYIDDTGALVGCAWVELILGAAMGAAMSMVPVSQVTETVEAGLLSDEFQDNLHEVLNIASALLNTDETAAHVRIRTLELIATGLSEDTLALLADPRAGGYYSVDVEGYGTGIFSFTLA